MKTGVERWGRGQSEGGMDEERDKIENIRCSVLIFG